MRRFSIVPVLILISILALLTFSCIPDTCKPSTVEFSHEVMGTYCRMVMAVGDDQKLAQVAAASALAEVQAIEALASTYQPDSEISQLSALPPNSPIPLSPDIYTVLNRSLHYSRLTAGAFDVTVGPLMNLWRAAAKRGIPPTSAEISTALQTVGYGKISLDPDTRTITLSQAGMSITLDAIVKGYAADLALAGIRREGVQAALVDLGGDVVCFGRPPDRPAWDIGIQNPFQPATGPMDTSPGSILATIRLTDAAVATSGNYQRSFRIQAKSYSQIIDPRTGYPVAQAPSVTIIAPTAADADALATACSVLSVPEALALINRIPRTEALLITGSPDHPTYHTSTGFEKYLLTPLPD